MRLATVTALLAAAAVLAGTRAAAQSTRTVTYNDHLVVPVHAKLRFTTLIVLPETEQILDFVCGDKDFWIVSGSQNLAYVKPAKAGATTNLNLVTASGRVYSFLLTEGTDDPDLKLYVQPDEATAATLTASPRFYTAADVDRYKRAAEQAQQEAAAAKNAGEAAKTTSAKQRDDAISAFRATYPIALQFGYVVTGNRPSFHVDAVYHDDRFTYIQAHAQELPALYEVVDGKPTLISFQVDHGVYIVPKILDRGYLVLGTKTLRFERKEERP